MVEVASPTIWKKKGQRLWDRLHGRIFHAAETFAARIDDIKADAKCVSLFVVRRIALVEREAGEVFGGVILRLRTAAE